MIEPKRQYLFIIAPPRSGSTLLQGLLNSSPDIQMWGENENFFYGLFDSLRRLRFRSGKGPEEGLPTKIFYGFRNYNEANITKQYSDLGRSILWKNAKASASVVGFKEVRYFERNDTLPEYLDFIENIFPNTKFIWLTRNVEHVIESAELANFNWGSRADSAARINKFNMIMRTRMVQRQNIFHIDYSDLKEKKLSKINSMFEFAESKCADSEILAALETQHGFRSRSK